MNFREETLRFEVAEEALFGIATCPDLPLEQGVLIIVGGPQYRVGSHRQFLLLARSLAVEGYPSLRFDTRGMGDSEGDQRNFETISEDIAAAIDAFLRACPNIRKLILWGLCDAASAALLYLQETHDSRIAGLVLLNPWVRTEASLAQTHIKHYYGQRLMQRAFWNKLFSGQMQIFATLRNFIESALQARSCASPAASSSFQVRMAEGLSSFPGQSLLILSGQDFTAREFLEYVVGKEEWSVIFDASQVRRVDLYESDHTFSSQISRRMVQQETLAWLAYLGR